MRQAYHTLNAKAAFQVMGFIIPIITFFIVIVTTIIMKIYLGIFFGIFFESKCNYDAFNF